MFGPFWPNLKAFIKVDRVASANALAPPRNWRAAYNEECQMSDLIVAAFDTETGADEMRDAMIQLQKEFVVELADAAVVVRGADGKVRVKQAIDLVGAGALGGAFWGMLIGLIFLVPWLGLAIGAAAGAIGGAFTDIGVPDDFIKQVGEQIRPGSSALFLLLNKQTPDRLIEEFHKFHGTILKTSLSHEEEMKLREAMGAGAGAGTEAGATV